MDCKDISRFLNELDKQPANLEERLSVNAHLRECQDCKEEWNAVRLLAAVPIPPTPAGLLDRVVEAVDKLIGGNVIPFPSRRTITIVGILLAASAAATMMLLERDDNDISGAEESRLETEASPEPPLVDAQATNTDTVAVNEADEIVDSTDSTAASVPDSPGEIALDMSTVLVLPVDNRTTDTTLAQHAATFREALADAISNDPVLNLAEAGAVTAFRNSGMNDTEIARTLGAGIFVRISTDSEQVTEGPRVNVSFYDAQEDFVFSFGGFRVPVDPPTAQDPGTGNSEQISQMQIERYLGTIRSRTTGVSPSFRVPDSTQELITTIYDPNANGFARGSALRNLMTRAQAGDSVTISQVMDAATLLAEVTDAPSARRAAWEVLRTAEAPTELVSVALVRLSTEEDDNVKVEIIKYLRAHSNEPNVRSDLELVANTATSAIVRDEAELALLSDDDRIGSLRSRFFDTTLPLEERLSVFAPNAEIQPPVDAEIADALLEVAASTENSIESYLAFNALRNAELELFIDPMLALLEPENPRMVREGAIPTLGQFIDDPRVHEALTRVAESDPHEMVRAMAVSWLTQPVQQ